MKKEKRSPLISQEEVRKNKAKTFLLIMVYVVLIAAAAYGIGWYLDSLEIAFILAGIVVFIVFPIQFLTLKASIKLMTKGRKPDPDNQLHMRAQVVLEKVSLGAGIKTPELLIIPTSVPNAFASGTSVKNAFVGVTEGLLQMLDEQELAGVMAHEVSHIVHRDILVSQLAVSLGSVLIILSAILFRMMLVGGGRGGSRNSRGGKGGALIIFVILAAFLLRIFASMISVLVQFAISRKREYAADAYAVRLTAYNRGLASALAKIGGVNTYDQQQQEALGGGNLSSMYIYYPAPMNKKNLFSTHPPIRERIDRLLNMY